MHKAVFDALLLFLQKQHGQENLLFWLHAEAFRILAGQVSSKQAESMANRIFNRFIKDDSISWICLGVESCTLISEIIWNHPDRITPDLFLAAQKECLEALEFNCIPRFIQHVMGNEKAPGIESATDTLYYELSNILEETL